MPASTSQTPRIVVGIDGSPSSVAALRWAIGQAALDGSTVEAITAWQIPAAMTGYGWAPVPVADCSDMELIAKRALEEAIVEAAGASSSPLVHGEIAQGLPAQVLIDASAGAALLVVGSRGHGGFAGALLGSVSQYCVHHAHCPVLIIRGDKSSEGS